MSFKVLVIAEDFTKDEHVLKPLFEKLLEDAGRAQATVEVCRDPNFQGVDAALNLDRLRSEVVARYPMVDLFVLLVDRDGRPGREDKVARIEAALAKEIPPHRYFVSGLAHQEVEVFILAGHELPPDWSWRTIREDPDVKNSFFMDFVRLKGTGKLPHDGRKKLMVEAVKNWNRIKSRCPEDIGTLLTKLPRSSA